MARGSLCTQQTHTDQKNKKGHRHTFITDLGATSKEQNGNGCMTVGAELNNVAGLKTLHMWLQTLQKLN